VRLVCYVEIEWLWLNNSSSQEWASLDHEAENEEDRLINLREHVCMRVSSPFGTTRAQRYAPAAATPE
jgi:hypothetical protein